MTTTNETVGPTTRTARTAPRRWVVGVDGSASACHAGRWAMLQAPGRADEIRLTTAWTLPVVPALPPTGPILDHWDVAGYEAAARAEAERAADVLGRRGEIPLAATVVEGTATEMLLREADDADLLVVGTRGRGGFARLVLGSTSTQCATHAVCPTAIVPETAPLEVVDDLVVAIDGSENSLAALRWAIDFAAPGSVVEAIEVWDVTPIAVGADQFFFPEGCELAHERFDHQVDGVLAAADPAHVAELTLTRRFVEGRPRQVLRDAAAGSRLLVAGARGHGTIGAALLGSVSTWLLHHVTTPMVVVPTPEDDGFDDDVAIGHD